MFKQISFLILAVVLAIGGSIGFQHLMTGQSVGQIVTSSGVWYRSGNMLRTNPSLPITKGRAYSTTTIATATLLNTELNGYSTIFVTPVIGSATLTLPATSTLSTFIPSTGDTTEVIIFNASSTAAINVTIAAGTGMVLNKSTTTAAIPSTGTGILKFFRKANTDIEVHMDIGA